MYHYHSLSEHFLQLHPHAFFLDMDDPEGLSDYLVSTGFLSGYERISRLEYAGNGGMNLVLRAFTSNRSFIIKQARPWVEKDPHLEAPSDRIIEESEYYKLVSQHPVLKKYHPGFLHFDETSYLLLLEDIGPVSDYTNLYTRQTPLQAEEAEALVQYLILLHNDFRTNMVYRHIYNRSVRKMNFENMFISAFHTRREANAPARELAWPPAESEKMLDEIKYLGRLYESDGACLVHGNFYPGSWLNSAEGIKIIDPEFCFFGPVEFDFGIFLAHLLISQQPGPIIKEVIDEYKSNVDFNAPLALNYAGFEIMRRLLSPDSLRLHLSIKERNNLLSEAGKMLIRWEDSSLSKAIKPD